MALLMRLHLVLALRCATDTTGLVGAGPPYAMAAGRDAGHSTAVRLVQLAFLLLLLIFLLEKSV